MFGKLKLVCVCVNDTTCWQTVGENSLPTCCCVVHTHQFELANTSWPTLSSTCEGRYSLPPPTVKYFWVLEQRYSARCGLPATLVTHGSRVTLVFAVTINLSLVGLFFLQVRRWSCERKGEREGQKERQEKGILLKGLLQINRTKCTVTDKISLFKVPWLLNRERLPGNRKN